MAREASITQEQVNATADAIRASGAKPTARAIRDQLGSGSMATILKLFQVWQAGQVKPAAQDVTLPPALTRALVDFIGQEVAGARAGLEAELATAQQSQADLIAESERQASHIEALTNACDELQAERAEMSGRLAVMESDLSAARDAAQAAESAAESARTELAKAQLRLETMPRLQAELDQVRAQLAESQAQAVSAEKQAAVLAARLDAAEARATSSERRESAALVKIEQARTDALELAGLRLQARELASANDAALAG